MWFCTGFNLDISRTLTDYYQIMIRSLSLLVHGQFVFFGSWSVLFFYRVTHLVQYMYFLYLGQLKNFFRTVTDSSSIHEFCLNTSWGQFISKSSWTQTMNYSCPVHEHFMNGLKCSWFHELHFPGVWPSSSWEDVHGWQRTQTHSKRYPEWLMWAKNRHSLPFWNMTCIVENEVLDRKQKIGNVV